MYLIKDMNSKNVVSNIKNMVGTSLFSFTG